MNGVEQPDKMEQKCKLIIENKLILQCIQLLNERNNTFDCLTKLLLKIRRDTRAHLHFHSILHFEPIIFFLFQFLSSCHMQRHIQTISLFLSLLPET